MTLLSATGILKNYGWRVVLRNVSVQVKSGDCVCIAGINGSGKSTLLKILSGLLTPDEGEITAIVNSVTIDVEQLPFHVGLVAPYLNLYDEFTPLELLRLQRSLHGEANDEVEIETTLRRVGLADRMNENVRTLSSGLQQRVSLALAVHRKPAFLMLDEPTITLDEKGRGIVEHEIRLHQDRGGIVVIATNDEDEKKLCSQTINLSI